MCLHSLRINFTFLATKKAKIKTGKFMKEMGFNYLFKIVKRIAIKIRGGLSRLPGMTGILPPKINVSG